jgi:hypothetical protein
VGVSFVNNGWKGVGVLVASDGTLTSSNSVGVARCAGKVMGALQATKAASENVERSERRCMSANFTFIFSLPMVLVYQSVLETVRVYLCLSKSGPASQ